MSTPTPTAGSSQFRTATKDGLDAWTENINRHPVFGRWWFFVLLIILLFPIMVSIITTPLGLGWQAAFAGAVYLLALRLNRSTGRMASLVLIFLSVLVSSRYIYWRVTQTLGFGLQFRTWWDHFFAVGLFCAELYAYVVLFLGFFQVLWPLRRKPLPMPADLSLWPTVDVIIPTYNEPLEIVRTTILAALDMDWPRDKLKVYVLDDGRRQVFKEFCEAVGAIHLTRADSKHAKAGNINRALQKISGEYVAIFDADHIPSRSFLQITMGWFVKQNDLAMVQTPHHFFSPDPFERNLNIFRKVPNEGELFYGLIQDGNDLWNACFFCGSCAVLRRKALDDVGGIAVETVTEDAHTALKMHRRGWSTAYLNIAQAAGLATESLGRHVGQRMRWARGMAQIFRTDNPLFGRGLTIAQRLCYTNAMLHFFYGLPRVVFLTAPLSFLFFHAHVIEATALMIAAYAGPHIALASLTNSRLQGRYRHSFWAEAYETVLATYILGPTMMAMINPKLGAFNVTAKGGVIERDFFDHEIARPYLVFLGLNLLGVVFGFIRLFWWNPNEIETVILNLLWTFYNLIILGVALSVAYEARQIRRTIRVATRIKASLKLADGKEVPCNTVDISEGGTAVEGDFPPTLVAGATCDVALAPDVDLVWMPAKVVRHDGNRLMLVYGELGLAQQRQLVYAIFGRADAWIEWSADRPPDRVGSSFEEVVIVGIRGASRVIGMYLSSWRGAMKSYSQRLGRAVRPKGAAASVMVAAMALAAGVAAWSPSSAYAQATGLPVGSGDPSVTLAATPAAGSDASSGLAMQMPIAGRVPVRTFTFEQLGIQKPIRLRGVQGEISIPLSVRDDEVVTHARLHLRFSHSPSLIFQLSHLNVFVNNELAATIPLSATTASGTERTIDIDPRLFVEYNQVGLQLIAHYTMDCEDPVHTSLWAVVSNKSTLELDTTPLALKDDLNLLPEPFFDQRDPNMLLLPFVFAGAPALDQLAAAGVVASWFGSKASYRGARFPAYFDALPPGNAVVFVLGSHAPAGIAVPDAGGGAARISVMPNPRDPAAKLLVLSAPDGAGLMTAAKSLSLGTEALSGPSTVVRQVLDPPARKPYDAPRWVPTNRPVAFSELVSKYNLQVTGLYPDSIRVPFHMPPDLFAWHSRGMKLNLKYRYTPTVGSKSTLNVSANGEFVEALALSHTVEDKAAEQRINLPFVSAFSSVNQNTVWVPDYKLASDNTLQFQYYFERRKEGACKDVIIDNLRGSVDEDSTLDLSNFPHYAYLPDLALFANGGFPFTRLADLAETVVVLPDRVDPQQLEAYLTIMGRFGNATGYPAFRVALAHSSDINTYKDRDILVIGTAGEQPLYDQWAEQMAMSVVNGETRLHVIGPVERLRARIEGRDLDAAYQHAGKVLLEAGRSLGAMESFQSPLSPGRTVVVLTAGQSSRLTDVANLLIEPGKSQFVQGDLVLLNGTEVNHYFLGKQYAVGHLPMLLATRRWFTMQPLALVVAVFLIALIVAVFIYGSLSRRAEWRGKP